MKECGQISTAGWLSVCCTSSDDICTKVDTKYRILYNGN